MSPSSTSAPMAVVSGAAGMTGSELARQLLARGWSVLGFDNFFASSRTALRDLEAKPGFWFFEWDLNRPSDMAALAQEVARRRASEKLAFVNCAAVVHTKHFYTPSATFETNVIGMRTFLDLGVRAGAQAFVNCSTSEVYSLKSFVEGGVRESDPLVIAGVETSQRASYAIGKLLTEFLLKEAVELGRIRGCSVRFANVYSEDEPLPEHIIPYTIQTLLRSPGITLLENARNTSRTFLHNRDSAHAVVRLLETVAALDGTPYNVGTGEEINIVRLVEKIGAQLGVTPVITFAGVRTADPPRRLLNTEKLHRLTGWVPAVGIDDGVRACVERARDRVR